VRGPGQTTLGQARTGGTGRGGTWTCHYYANLGGEIDGGAFDDPIAPTPGQYVALICLDDAGQVVHTAALYYEPGDPLGGIAAAYRAMELARERLVLDPPAIATSPPSGSFQLVGLPSYLSVGDAWATRSETASIGAVSSTVTATPVEVRWDPGDGSGAITCSGPGSTAAPECTHTYIRSSGGATFDLTATITWEVAWTSTTGEGGALEPVTRTATLPVAVQEAQALIR
jgi:hypothetical protein